MLAHQRSQNEKDTQNATPNYSGKEKGIDTIHTLHSFPELRER